MNDVVARVRADLARIVGRYCTNAPMLIEPHEGGGARLVGDDGVDLIVVRDISARVIGPISIIPPEGLLNKAHDRQRGRGDTGPVTPPDGPLFVSITLQGAVRVDDWPGLSARTTVTREAPTTWRNDLPAGLRAGAAVLDGSKVRFERMLKTADGLTRAARRPGPAPDDAPFKMRFAKGGGLLVTFPLWDHGRDAMATVYMRGADAASGRVAA